MAHSFVRDLHELDHGTFVARYGGPKGLVDFLRLRTAATGGAWDRVVAASTVSLSGTASSSLILNDLYNDPIITRVSLFVTGAAAGTVTVELGGDGIFSVVLSPGGLAQIDLPGLEETNWLTMDYSHIVPTGTVSFTAIVLGYQPDYDYLDA